jgi:hypothetical protein
VRWVRTVQAEGFLRQVIDVVVISTVEALQSEFEAKRKPVKRYYRVDTDRLHKIKDLVSYAIFLILLIIILDLLAKS